MNTLKINALRTAVLFSGGKDSSLALDYALKSTDVKCLITMISVNKESYMFHTPNINLAGKQAECIGLPIMIHKTKGKKEDELKDLEKAIRIAIKKYAVQGIYTGAVGSVYQASRIQKICDDLKIECINPLWQKDQIGLLNELIEKRFEVMIIGIAAEGFDKSWLGRILDKKIILQLKELNKQYGSSPAFEGGEAESFVLDAPYFKKRLIVKKARKVMTGEYSGYYEIEEIEMQEK